MCFELRFERRFDEGAHFRWDLWTMAWIVEVMRRAEVVSLEPPMPLPSWPPAGVLIHEEPIAEALIDLSSSLLQEACAQGVPLRTQNCAEIVESVAPLLEYPVEGRLLQCVTAHVLATEGALRARSRTDGRVPSFKFETNEGWLVTPEECELISSGLRRQLERQGTGLFPDSVCQSPLVRTFIASTGLAPQRPRTPGLLEARAWMMEWVTYNDQARDFGGYRVT